MIMSAARRKWIGSILAEPARHASLLAIAHNNSTDSWI
jgi:hypothetical protein